MKSANFAIGMHLPCAQCYRRSNQRICKERVCSDRDVENRRQVRSKCTCLRTNGSAKSEFAPTGTLRIEGKYTSFVDRPKAFSRYAISPFGFQINMRAPDLRALPNFSGFPLRALRRWSNAPRKERSPKRGATLARTVLIVDDSRIIRRTVSSALESDGFAVCGEAKDGQEAIDLAEKLSPDLIILDLSMPVMNGLEIGR